MTTLAGRLMSIASLCAPGERKREDRGKGGGRGGAVAGEKGGGGAGGGGGGAKGQKGTASFW